MWLLLSENMLLIYLEEIGLLDCQHSDADWACSPATRRSTSGYCILIGGNMISWRNKKHNIVARSSAEAEYHDMASTTY